MNISSDFFCLILGIWLSAASASVLSDASVSEDAQRHMARGNAAVEMAKSSEEYAPAVEEYRRAIELSPSWPDPYFNLGLVQEKMGKFKEAAQSLRDYLKLAPQAPDAAQIREQIYKLEYKAEQTLSPADILQVLSSGFSVYPDQWRLKVLAGTGDSFAPCGRNWSMQELFLRKDGEHSVRALASVRYSPSMQETYQSLRISGPVLNYRVVVNVCDKAANQQSGNCDSIVEHQVEVVSKSLVRVQQTVLRQGFGAGSFASGKRFTCSYEKVQ